MKTRHKGYVQLALSAPYGGNVELIGKRGPDVDFEVSMEPFTTIRVRILDTPVEWEPKLEVTVAEAGIAVIEEGTSAIWAVIPVRYAIAPGDRIMVTE